MSKKAHVWLIRCKRIPLSMHTQNMFDALNWRWLSWLRYPFANDGYNNFRIWSSAFCYSLEYFVKALATNKTTDTGCAAAYQLRCRWQFGQPLSVKLWRKCEKLRVTLLEWYATRSVLFPFLKVLDIKQYLWKRFSKRTIKRHRGAKLNF